MIEFIKRLFLGRRILGLVLAIATTVILGVIFQTQNVLARLGGIGADITIAERFSMTLYDVLHLGSLYAVFVAPALLIAILICDIITPRIQFARPPIYGLGGAAAIYVMLFAMKIKFFDIHMLAGARDALGIGLQMFAGALGGLLFVKINQPKIKAG